MCRIAAYTGPELKLEQFLLEPRHSLYRQSWQPREMREAVVNADGFGVGWYQQQVPELYLNARPVWNDINLPVLAKCLSSTVWAANVRSATPGQAVHELNCQPFIADTWMFLHNGFIENFNTSGKEKMMRLLAPAAIAAMRGETDSAFICALLQQIMSRGAAPVEALLNLTTTITENMAGHKIMLNIVICRPGEIYALRHSIREHCATLYTCYNGESFPEAHLCASEAFDQHGWQPVPEHSLCKCIAGQNPEYMQLPQDKS